MDTIYTGKGLTPELPQDGGKAMGRLSDFITRAEEIKYKAFKDNESWFLKTQDIDPAVLISIGNQTAQRELFDNYNKESAAIMQQYNNNPPLDKKQEILAKKNIMIAKQNEMLSKQNLAEQHRAIVTQNPLRYNKTKFDEEYAKFITTGDYNLTAPPLRSKNPTLFLQDQSNKLNKEKIGYGVPTKDALGRTVDTYSNIPEDQIGNFIENNLMNDDQALQGVIEDFLADKSPEKMAMLTDTNGDGRITNEDADDNIILKWAKQKPEYINAVRKLSEGTPKNPSTSTTKKEPGIAGINGKKRDIDPKYGNISRHNIYSLGGDVILRDVPTRNALLLDDSGVYNYEIKGNLARAYLKDYDADRKTIIVQVTSKDPVSYIETQQLVEVPQENIPNYQNIKLTVNGRQTTVGELSKPTGAQSDDPWKEYKRK